MRPIPNLDLNTVININSYRRGTDFTKHYRENPELGNPLKTMSPPLGFPLIFVHFMRGNNITNHDIKYSKV